MAAPKYIMEEARKLNNALAAVAKHAAAIESWVDNNTDEDGMDFFYENNLDKVYEFDLDSLLEELGRF